MAASVAGAVLGVRAVQSLVTAATAAPEVRAGPEVTAVAARAVLQESMPRTTAGTPGPTVETVVAAVAVAPAVMAVTVERAVTPCMASPVSTVPLGSAVQAVTVATVLAAATGAAVLPALTVVLAVQAAVEAL